ncbi:putative peptidoglycan lipid II flippase [Arthrobacter silviterrae]|uniref:Virulence factor MviN n=2 Tax=Arthrobacter silviterrae TaxID=2026658 RepID=A0ABX0DGK0_9MICC|nr:lipid II flippase MurJ [Arthrobacter silviterrae]MDQ0278243.1 putative peptidoglycan lipid II flippase [Arthrobacter silviterrae]NGN84504.1 virulence factor MviN [Arthrobacter silviterrae]
MPPSNAPVRRSGLGGGLEAGGAGAAANTRGAGQPQTQAQAARSSASMAVGTLASRILGFIKGIVLGIAVAGTTVGDLFESSNYLPNLIFMLLAGGVFNAVLIPQIIKASKQPDKGTDFISRLLTLGVTGLFVVTALVVVLVAPITSLSTTYSGSQLKLAITFGMFLLPQIFFYGLYSLLGQVLNAHNAFKAYAWAPVLNNVVAIAGLLVFIAVAGSSASTPHTVDNWTAGQSWLLAGTATLGIVVQSVILLIPVQRLGLGLRPKFGWRGTGLGATARIAGWTMGTMVIGNLSFILILKIATIPTGSKPDSGTVADSAIPGVYALNRAVELYIMPHSIIALSIATVMFTAMARAAAAHDFSGLRSSLSRALRTTGVATVFAGVALIVLSGPFGMLFGGNQEFAGRQIAIVLAILAIGAPSYSINFILNRVLYAQEDAKTPFVIQCIMVCIGLGTALLAALLPAPFIIYGIACSYTVSNIMGPVVSHLFLRARLGDYGGGLILQAHMRFLAAALVSGLAGEFVLMLLGGQSAQGFMWHSIAAAVVTLAAVGCVMAAVYVVMLKLLHVHELDDILAPLRSKLLSRLPGRR